MIITPPSSNQSFGYFDRYISKANYPDLLNGLIDSKKMFAEFINHKTETELNYRYLPDKWTIKEIVGHIIDCEIVFAYRALRFARMDKTPLHSFDENNFAKYSNAGTRNSIDLINHYETVRDATICFFKSIDETMLDNMGRAGDNNISVRAIGFIIIGHQAHHVEIINERYSIQQ